MEDIKCPAPDCETTWSIKTPEAVLVKLLDIHERTAHPNTNPPNVSTTTGVKAEKVKRPSISCSGTSEEWSYFINRWTDYKNATQLTGHDIVYQLLECCDDNLRKDLTRSHSSLTKFSEETLLEYIKSLAVRRENIMVARLELQRMIQDRDEPVRAFYARLKGQANVCQFTIKCSNCNCDNSYCDKMVRDTLVTGLADDEIRQELLGLSNQEVSLEETVRYVEAKESGKRSASMLKPLPSTVSINASTSSYRRAEKKRLTPQIPDRRSPKLCSHCGNSGHGHGRQDRINNCPAYNHTCSKCGIPHHLEKVCQKSKRRYPLETNSIDNNATAVYESLCSVHNEHSSHDIHANSITLDHHVYDSIRKTWQKRKSDPQPIVEVTVQLFPEDAMELGVKNNITRVTKPITLSAVADTGCQSCLASSSLLQSIGIDKSHLTPTTMKMRAANKNNIEILGALVIRITGQSASDEPQTTRQIVYITDSTDKFFLSMEACRALGIIPGSFPSIGSTANLSELAEKTDDETCSCPERTKPPPLPTSLPFPPTEENVERLEKWLLEYYKSSTFNICTHQSLPKMSGPPMSLMINDVTPVAYHTPIPVPIHWQDRVKQDLDQDVRLGVIEPVPIGTPVTWCHRMVVCAKKSGKPRRTVDFQALNRHAARETHHTQSPFHQVRSVPPNTRKSTFDAWNGYHSIALNPDDRHLTTFITPWGRYRYCVCPQGYLASGDAYTRRFDEIVNDFPNKTKIIDDTIMWSSTIEESFFQAAKWLDLCGQNGIILNPTKFTFSRKTVEFAGFEISPTSVRPCPKVLEAIKRFPKPRNITDIRSWFGLVNQVAYAFASAERMLPFRNLLKPNSKFEWNEQLDKVFEETKVIIIEEIKKGVEIFDKSKPTCLATDFCKDGLGFWLLQKHCNCNNDKPLCCRTGWKITLAGSRFTSVAESRYAPIEGEALAVVEGLEKTRHFVLGCPNLTIIVDHKPLLKVFGDRNLEAIPNPRLRNLKEKTLRFRFKIKHVPGVRHTAADAMSRHPVGPAQHLCLPDDITTIHCNLYPIHHIPFDILHGIRSSPELASTICANIDESLGISSVTWDDIRLASSSDESMHSLFTMVEDGFPDSKNKMPQSLKNFYQFRDKLSTFDGVILYNDRIVIPPSLQPKILEALHSAHQGTSQMCSRANASFFWPGMTTEIHDMRSRCSACNRNAPSQPNAPPTPPIQPQYPFQCICADYFHHGGHNYLVIVDRYSNWPIVERAKEGSQGLITSLRRTFATYGICDELSSDGGPEFTSSATQTFLRNWGVHHRLSSVAFPHSNSRAEIGVKTIKRMIVDNTGPDGTIDTDMFQRAVLQYRNTPDRDTRLSPAMCIFGRPIRDFIPILPGKYIPHQTWQETRLNREEALRNRHMRDMERLSAHTRSLPPLVVGDCVRIQNQVGPYPNKWDKTGIIVEVRQFDQYVVRVDGSGRVTLRNRKFLRKYVPVIPRLPITSLPFSENTVLKPAKSSLLPFTPMAHTQNPTTCPPEQQKSSTIPIVNHTHPNEPEDNAIPQIDDPYLPAPVNEALHNRTPRTHTPRALKVLEPYNKPGLKENKPLQTRLRRD